MCGITGIIKLDGDTSPDVILKMNNSLIHRGPDCGNFYISENKKIALGHRRLSFLDLSDDASQPMRDISRRLTLVFNGEIYNYLELKEELQLYYDFKTKSDTEVILAGYIKWGIDVVNKLKGMFAFTLLDERENRLFMVRDRFGIKPLYYSICDDKLIFASELKAVLASNEVPNEIDFSAFCDFFVYRYIPSPKTIWQNVKKLEPAHYIEINTENLTHKLTEYWRLKSGENIRDEVEIISKVNSILSTSVCEHVRADVPIGSFLSGGYDSSALVLLMKKIKLNPETFSIGFSNWEKSEDQYATIVARHLEVPNKVMVADEKSLELIDLLSQVYDEPLADISIVPTYLVSKLAKSSVKAVLSGEGADEIFGGYSWQKDFFKLSTTSSFLKRIRNKFKPIDTVDFYANAMAMGFFDSSELKKMLHPNLHKYVPKDVHWFYRKHFKGELSALKSIQYLDMKCFMGELVLTKVDRASMANSLEVRVPFLDHELLEYIFDLKETSYFKPEFTKFALYKNISQDLPIEILNRQKQGFVGPDSYYMNIEWYKDQLKNCKLVEYKLINQSYLDNLMNETYTWKLWKILIMEKWFKKWAL